MRRLFIFTDGSVCGNGTSRAYGGIGIFFPDGDAPNVSEPFLDYVVTNQRTELYAIFFAIGVIIKIIKHFDEIIIYSDSEYSINSLTKWAPKWSRMKWKTSSGTQVQNLDLIKPIYKILQIYPQIKFVHVRSHTKQKDYLSLCNDTVDHLATRGTEISRRLQKLPNLCGKSS